MTLSLYIKRLLLMTSSLGVVAGAGSAQAQDSSNSLILEEIVVTAEKREAKLQDVPIAVSAYTDAVRDVVGIRGVEDIAAFTPGLQFSSLDRMSVRGIGRLTNALGSDPGVAVYNDGFYTSSLTQAGKSQLFVDRVEVLRGPQGTLYGRNSMGGAVNIISKRPSTSYEGEARAIVGNYEQRSIEGSFSGPITDSFRFRMLGQTQQRDEGYFENRSGEDKYRQDRRLMEVQLEADLTDNIQWWVKYSKEEWDENNSDGSLNAVLIDPYPYQNGIFPTGNLVPFGPYFTGPTLGNISNPSVNDPYVIDQDAAANYTLGDNNNIVTHLTFDLGPVALKYVGGYAEYEFATVNDYDRTPLTGSYPVAGVPVFPQYLSYFSDRKEYYSNEINLTSNGNGPHRWIVGLYQYHESTYNPVYLTAPNQAQLDAPRLRAGVSGLAPSATLADPNPERRFYTAIGDLESDSLAAFGQFDYAINDSWKAIVGVRYTQDEKAGEEYHRLVAFLPLPVALGGTGNASTDVSPTLNSRRLESDWDNVSGKVGVEWSPSDDLLVYANYNRGYKSGGFNLGTIIGGEDAAAATVDEELLNAYEIGFKSNFGSSFQLNGATFFYQYDDAQVPFPEFRSGINTNVFRNIDAESYGAELELLWAATDAWSFLLNYSYLNTEITEACCYYDPADRLGSTYDANVVGQISIPSASGTPTIYNLQDLEGNQLPQAPENKFAFNTNYRFDFAPGSLTFSGSYTWQDETTYSLFGNPRAIAPAFGLADFRILWEDTKDRYTLIAFVDNAFDEEGTNGVVLDNHLVLPAEQTPRTYNLLPPRTFGLEVQVRF